MDEIDTMTTETTPVEQPAAEHTPVELSYAGPSTVVLDDSGTLVKLSANMQRDPVRDALSVLYGIVGSDFRYAPKDRTAYLAYMRMRRETAGLGMWKAQQAYFEWIQRNDPLAFVPLDPVVTAHPDQLLLEVFSKDE